MNRPRGWFDRYSRLAPFTVPLYAIVVAVVVGGLVILAAGANPVTAYGALFNGAFGGVDAIAGSLARSIPFIIASVAVAFGFKAGLFNIGAEGQLLVGALASAWVGTLSWVAGLPGIVAVPVVLGAGALGGLGYGGIPGVLKARTGAHEVITTIMLNAIALRLVEWLISSRDPVILLDASSSVPRTHPIAASARLPQLLAGTGLHAGLLVAVGLSVLVWFVLMRTTFGFEVRTVGINPDAARYAGMSVRRAMLSVLACSGALAGIAGAGEISGAQGFLTPGSFAGVGFDSIGIALLARANPLAVIPTAILWGALLAGAPRMQLEAGLSIDLVRIVQALIILFVAADVIVRGLFRLGRSRDGAQAAGAGSFAKGWSP
ncbi:MAG: ABC transporter permease [Egibacteraceae bacterium]